MKTLLLVLVFITQYTAVMLAQHNESVQSNDTYLERDTFLVEERMPVWYSCDSSHFNRKEAQVCTREKFAEYVYSHFRLPRRAKKKKLSGTVVVSFTIEKDGQIEDVKILRDIGGGCGKALKKITESMPAWFPAMQRGKYVSVRFNFPLKIGYDLNN